MLIHGGIHSKWFLSRLTKRNKCVQVEKGDPVLPSTESKLARAKKIVPKTGRSQNSRVLKLRIQTVPVRIAHTFVCGSPLCTFKWCWTAHRHE